MNLNAVQRCMDGEMVLMGAGFNPAPETCDCCGRELSGPAFQRNEDDLTLCPACRAWKGEWAGRPMAAVLQNYLIGNVI